jgi:hypothetical protein
MPSKRKPPGFEKWTWDEINAGRKMSKGEKRSRRLAISLGATKRSDGQIQRPALSENPTYYAVFIGLALFGFLMIVLNALNKR